MKRKRVLLSSRAVVVFVLMLTISGGLLAASGHFDNPVVALQDTVAMNDLLGGADALALPPLPANRSQSITLTALDTSSNSVLPALNTDSAASTFTLPSLDQVASADTSSDSAGAGADRFSLPPLDAAASADPSSAAAGAAVSTASLSADDNSGVRWSEIGDVLFDLWFLAAVTAFVIVFQRGVGFVRARLPARPALSLAR